MVATGDTLGTGDQDTLSQALRALGGERKVELGAGQRYRFGELIGRGGMGEVWCVDDLRLERDVALKRLRRRVSDEATVARDRALAAEREALVREGEAQVGLGLALARGGEFIDAVDHLRAAHGRLHEGVELLVPIEQVQVGDLVVVNAGELIAVDGVIEDGVASIDQHVLTGEAQPEERGPGEQVFACTLLLAGRIVVRVEQAGSTTLASQIGEVLNATDDFEVQLDTRGEFWANRTVLPTLLASGLSMLAFGPATSVVVLNSNYSEVFRLSMPLGLLNHLRVAARKGLLIKDGRSLETVTSLRAVVFDKTGTLTREQPHVGIIHTCAGYSESQVLQLAATAEQRQRHPIAHAIMTAARDRGLAPDKIDDARYRIGFGIEVAQGEQRLLVGSGKFMDSQGVTLPDTLAATAAQALAQGHTVIYVAVDGQPCGAVELRPTIRPQAREVIRALEARGLSVHVLSGDNRGPVESLARELGINSFFAEMLPEDKATMIESLQREHGHVCFVGDGINDSIAMKKAAVSVSLGDSSDVAMGASQVILLDGDLRQLLDLFDVGDRLRANQVVGVGTAVAPSVISMFGAVALNFTVLTTLLFFNFSVALGVGVAAWPLVRERLEGRRPQISPSPAAAS